MKGSNMLVSDSIEVLLCDFGLAKIAGSSTASWLAGHGSLPWQAPELFDGASKTFQSDVYAFGMTVYQVGKLDRLERRRVERLLVVVAER